MTLAPLSSLESARKKFLMNRRASCLESGNQRFLGSNTAQFTRIGKKKFLINSTHIMSRKWESNVFGLRRPK